MRRNLFTLCLALLPCLALAGEAADPLCQALSERVAEAVILKSEGVSVNDAISQLSHLPNATEVNPAIFNKRIKGAIRVAYMMGMSPENSAEYYLTQCQIGSLV